MNLETEINSELWLVIRRSYESGAWSNTILDAIYHLSDTIRAKTDLQSDGATLVGQALGGKNPKLRLNRLQTESELSVQMGVENLLRGVFMAFRNPRSHGRIEDTQADADAIILFVNYLLRLLGHARTEYSLETCVQRVLEENFVPNDRYAALLVSEIPARHRLEVFLTVYRRKSRADGEKLKYFLKALLSQLAADEQEEVFGAISLELRETKDDSVVRTILQALDPDDWLRLDEVARLRIEHRLIRCMKDGSYSSEMQRCTAGGLATWATEFFRQFTLKKEAYDTLVEKLHSSSREDQDYVFQFFFSALALLADKPSWYLQNALIKGLKAGDSRFKRAITNNDPFDEQPWSKELREALTAFKPIEPSASIDDDYINDGDDVPF
jgi:uncharacterized protein (TIGR02391 family)